MKKEMYDLTFPQNNIWLVDRVYDDTSINMITGIIKLEKDFNEKFCKIAINEIAKNNDAMRINIKLEDNKVCQFVKDYEYDDAKVVDMTTFSNEEIEAYIQKQAIQKIDIFADKLYEFKILKYSDESGCVILRMHHIISDAWSCSKTIEQFIKYYENARENIIEDVVYPSYIDFVKSQKDYLESDKYLKDREYYREYLKDIGNTAFLKEKSRNISNHSKRYNIRLDEEINDKILEFCKENRISPYVLMLTILSVYMYRITNVDDIVIGTPVLNRANFKEKQALGLFITTIPIRIKIDSNLKILELAKNVSSNTMSAFRHQRFPYEHILNDFRENIDNKSNLYSVLLSYQNAKVKYENEDIYSAKWYSNNMQSEDLQMHIFDLNSTGILEIGYDYLDELFSEDEIKYLHTRLMSMLQNLILDKDISVGNINIMSDFERNKIMHEFNDTKREFSKYKSVIDLFEAQVEENGEKVALIFENTKLTYNELNERANVVANELLRFGVKPNDILAVMMKRSDKLIVTLLAILKCRAAYLPIDSSYPQSRIEYILKNSQSNICIKDDEFDFKFEDIELFNIDCDKLFEKASLSKRKNLNIPFRSKYMNYLMYTSGSTGNPKGVAVSIKNLLNFVLGINEVINIGKDDRVVSITTVSFDIFGLELFVTLSFGATLILANESECVDGNKLNKLCLKNNVTTIQTTPTKLKMLLTSNEYIYNMNKILLGGEKVPKDFVDRLKGITKASIYDVYGPTETTIWSTIQDITNCTKISVGRPIANTKVYILDDKNKLLPIGVNGQVAISGDGVSIGYYNNKEATYKNYIYSNELNEKVYLTGDLGRQNFDSTISILDRIDLQIKLNGQRIELEEIERNIKMYGNIKEAAVVLKENRFLVCYYLKNDINVDIDEKDIIKYLSDKLPIYMIPTIYKELDKFPLTLNGKTDRKELNKLDVVLQNNVLYEKPKTPLQETIYKVWVKVLGRDDFGINDKFFEIGADSLSAIKTQIELLSFGIHIEYKNLLKYQSIKELEGYIKRNNKKEDDKILDEYKDYTSILSTNKNVILKNQIKKSNIKNILLTGVTGFLGIHILDSFMKQESGKIYCIIRGKNKKNSKDRFIETLHYYFDDKYDFEIGKRIILIEGNFTEDNIGVSEENFSKIVSDVDLVIHSAACVKHYGEASYFKKVNIDGTKNIAKFCFENNKKLIHISTISVSGNSFEIINSNENLEKVIDFDETCFYQEQNLDNVYVYTKFKAEEVVLEYIEKGLEANILRVGNLTGRYSDLKFQHNVSENAFSNKIKTFIDFGYFPESNSDIYLEFTPVDECAKAIIKISEYFNMSHNMFHLYDNEHVYICEFVKILSDIGLKLNIVEDEEFVKAIEDISHSNNNQILNGIINDLNENSMLNYKTSVNVKSDYTRKYLDEIGFNWPKIDSRYVIGYINYLREIGFIDK